MKQEILSYANNLTCLNWLHHFIYLFQKKPKRTVKVFQDHHKVIMECLERQGFFAELTIILNTLYDNVKVTNGQKHLLAIELLQDISHCKIQQTFAEAKFLLESIEQMTLEKCRL